MPLILALKNRSSIIVASDAVNPGDDTDRFGQFMLLPNRTILLMAGNLDAVKHTVSNTVFPKITESQSAAGVAQLLHAAFTLEILPIIDNLKGRVEVIIAGIDPLRHTQEPSIYYIDSATDFSLQFITKDAIAAGSTAAISTVLDYSDLGDASTNDLEAIAKECFTTTKLRWPEALGNHVKLGAISAHSVRSWYI